MKILVLSALYAPYPAGGAERVARTLATAVQSLGDEVVVLTTSMDGREEERLIDEVRVRSIPLRNVYSFAERESASAAKKALWHVIDAYNPLMGRAVRRVITEERPDVVHTHVMTGFTVAAWGAADDAGVPIIHTLHDFYLLCARSSLTRGGIVCTRRHLECAMVSAPRVAATRLVKHVVGVSRFVLDRHHASGAFADSDKTVIPNPCHIVGATQPAAGSSETLRIGYLGRVEANKGIHVLLEAVGGLVPGSFSLSIAGHADSRYLDELRSRYPIVGVTFLGVVAGSMDLLANIDVLVVPSFVPETFGLSAAEALAAGLPVIASNRGALPEMVTHGKNGFLFDPDDPARLRAILEGMIAEPASLKSMAPACRRSVESFAPAVVGGIYRELYARAAGSR